MTVKFKKALSFIVVLCIFLSLTPMLAQDAAAAPPDSLKGQFGPIIPEIAAGGNRDFIWPLVGNHNIKCCFYENDRYHYAIDISAPGGTSILASYSGTVYATGYDSSMGNYVVLQHEYRLRTGAKITLYSRYKHMSSIKESTITAKNNHTVINAGEVIGYVGTTGDSTGNHLDFQILYGGINPQSQYSIDIYGNNLMEPLADDFVLTDSWSCGRKYVENIRRAYSQPLTPNFVAETYSSYCTVTITNSAGADVWSLPVSHNSDASSVSLGKLSKGTEVDSLAMVKSTLGEWYYKISYDGQDGYVWCKYTSLKKTNANAVTASGGHATISSLTKGSPYDVDWKLTSERLNMVEVLGVIRRNADGSGDPVYAPHVDINSLSYQLGYRNGDSIDSNLPFNNLDIGDYCFAIRAKTRNYYWDAANAVQTYEDWYHVPVSFSFTVVTPGTTTVKYYLNVNGILDGDLQDGTNGYGTFDVYINGSQDANDVKDYYKQWAAGTSYEIKDIKAVSGHTYDGVQRDPLVGTVTKYTEVNLQFSTEVHGHNYVAVVTPATCASFGYTTYTCSDCGDSYVVSHGEWSAWSENYPENVGSALIESKMQYRYADTDTVTSSEASMPGYELVDSEWAVTDTGTIDYVSSWPSGFNTSNSLYTQYHKTPKTAVNTATKKVTVSSSEIGYIYWHWCRGSYTDGPIDRKAMNASTSECGTFHAFYSTTVPTTLKSTENGALRQYSNAGVCKDTYWYYYIPVLRQTYTEEDLVNVFQGTGDWSVWIDTPVEASDTRQVETRTVYRYSLGELPPHQWDEGTVIQESGPGTPGKVVYECLVCGTTRTELTPASVTSITAAASSGTITVIWSAAEGADHYRIARQTTGESWVLLEENHSGTSFEDTDAVPGKRYRYAVTPENAAGRGTGATSDVVTALAAIVAPGPVESITAEAQPGVNLVTWSAAAGADHYRIARQTTGESWILLEENHSGTSFEDADAVPGKRYRYAVTPENTVGRGTGATSAAVTALAPLTAPGPVESISAQAQPGKIVVTWSAAEGADHYRIARQTTGTSYILLDGNYTGTSYEDTDVVPEGRYRYFVCAENDAGKGDGAISALVIVPALLTAPGPVASITAEAQPGKILVSWSAAEGADHYRIARQTTGTGYILLDGNYTGTSYEDTDVVPEGRYRYFVCAENDAGKGTGATSALVIVPAPLTAPGAVESITAETQPGKIVVTWSAADGADHYRIARQTTGTGYILLDGNYTGTSYEDTDVVPEGRYRYFVCAENDAGKGTGATSTLAIVPAPLTAPGTVASISAQAQPGVNVITWSEAEGADHYRIARQSTNTAWVLLDGNYSGTSYQDTDIVAGTRYRYLVCAENEVGKGTSATSTAVTALESKTAPGAVPAVAAAALPGKIMVFWSAAEGADHYRIARQITGGSWVLLDGNVSGTSYEDTGVASGTRCRYLVCAENEVGKGASATSDVVTAP